MFIQARIKTAQTSEISNSTTLGELCKLAGGNVKPFLYGSDGSFAAPRAAANAMQYVGIDSCMVTLRGEDGKNWAVYSGAVPFFTVNKTRSKFSSPVLSEPGTGS